MRTLNARRMADGIWSSEEFGRIAIDQLLDPTFRFVGKFVAIGIKQLDAVVGVRIVGRRDHNAQVGAQRSGEHGNGRGRHRT